MTSVSDLQKKIAQFLRTKSGEKDFTVFMYRDNAGENPIPIAGTEKTFYATVGLSAQSFQAPESPLELLTYCPEKWAPNALASSAYWLKDHGCDGWPLVCENVITENTQTPTDYRHMAFIPAGWVMEVDGETIKWLMGVPLTEAERQFTTTDVAQRVTKSYPDWLINP